MKQKMDNIFGLLISGLLIGLILFFASTVPADKSEGYSHKMKENKKDDNDEDFNIAIS